MTVDALSYIVRQCVSMSSAAVTAILSVNSADDDGSVADHCDGEFV